MAYCFRTCDDIELLRSSEDYEDEDTTCHNTDILTNQFGGQLTSSFQCTGCHLIISGSRSLVRSMTDAKGLQFLNTVCDGLFLLKRFCKSILTGPIAKALIRALKEGLSSDDICAQTLHVCAPKSSLLQGEF